MRVWIAKKAGQVGFALMSLALAYDLVIQDIVAAALQGVPLIGFIAEWSDEILYGALAFVWRWTARLQQKLLTA